MSFLLRHTCAAAFSLFVALGAVAAGAGQCAWPYWSCTLPAPVLGPWAISERVTIRGYTGTAQDPHITADGSALLFDTHSDTPSSATHVHYAISDGDYKTFTYAGPIGGMQEDDPTLQGGANTDSAGNIYWLTGRFPGHTIARGLFHDGVVTGIQPVLGIDGTGLDHMGAIISRNGQSLYFTDNTDTTSKLIVATKNADGSFRRLLYSDVLLGNINDLPVVYGGGTSGDELEIYFVGFTVGDDPSTEHIYMATRPFPFVPFGIPVALTGNPVIEGTQEGASISLDGHHFYFHKIIDAATAEIWVMTR